MNNDLSVFRQSATIYVALTIDTVFTYTTDLMLLGILFSASVQFYLAAKTESALNLRWPDKVIIKAALVSMLALALPASVITEVCGERSPLYPFWPGLHDDSAGLVNPIKICVVGFICIGLRLVLRCWKKAIASGELQLFTTSSLTSVTIYFTILFVCRVTLPSNCGLFMEYLFDMEALGSLFLIFAVMIITHPSLRNFVLNRLEEKAEILFSILDLWYFMLRILISPLSVKQYN